MIILLPGLLIRAERQRRNCCSGDMIWPSGSTRRPMSFCKVSVQMPIENS